MKYAFGLLLITIIRYYGYYALPYPSHRVAAAFGGIHVLCLSIAMLWMVFRRLSDWRSSVLIMAALTIAVAESLFIAVCGSWYAFIYKGPYIAGDSCNVMTGMEWSKPIGYTVAILLVLILPRMWSKKWVMRRSGI